MSAGAGAIVLVGRVLFSIFFVRSGWGHLTKREGMIGFAKTAGLPLAYLAGWPSGVWLLAASASVALGIWPDIGALMLGVFVIPAAWYFHRFWTIDDPVQKQSQASSFYRNIEILGASLVMFGLFLSAGTSLRFTLIGPLARW
jgi:putative oxidoreductase